LSRVWVYPLFSMCVCVNLTSGGEGLALLTRSRCSGRKAEALHHLGAAVTKIKLLPIQIVDPIVFVPPRKL
jgi:hypothetical protein